MLVIWIYTQNWSKLVTGGGGFHSYKWNFIISPRVPFFSKSCCLQETRRGVSQFGGGQFLQGGKRKSFDF